MSQFTLPLALRCIFARAINVMFFKTRGCLLCNPNGTDLICRFAREHCRETLSEPEWFSTALTVGNKTEPSFHPDCPLYNVRLKEHYQVAGFVRSDSEQLSRDKTNNTNIKYCRNP